MTPNEKRAAFPHPAPPKLTERRKAILRYCHEYAVCHGWAASVSEIVQAVRAEYTEVRYDLQALDTMGYIVYAGNRQIRVLWLP